MRLASKSRNELFCCRRRTIRVDLRQYFCYRLLKNSRNDFLLRYIDDAVCIQSSLGMTGRLTKARVIKMPMSSATPCALRASFSACIFAATLLRFRCSSIRPPEAQVLPRPVHLPQTQVRLCFSAQCCRPASYRHRCPLPRSGYGNHVRCSMQRLRISG